MPERSIEPLSISRDDIDVKRLRLTPGDIVVVNVDRDITAAEAAHIKAIVEPIVEPHQVLVTSRGVTIEIMEPAEVAYSSRLADFIVEHIGEAYTAEECGRVLEVRADDP